MNRERADRIVRQFTLVTLVLPAAVTIAGLIIQLVELPHAPARIPAYWGTLGGWWPAWLPLVFTVMPGFALPAVFGLGSLPSLRRGERSPTFRLFGAQALGLSVLLTIVATSLLVQNVGSASSLQNSAWFPLIVAIPAGVAAALVGWFLQPGSSRPTPGRAVIPLELESSNRAAWMHMAYLPVPAVAVIIAVTTMAAIRAAIGWAAGDRDGIGAILSVVTLLLIGVLATTAAFRVRVDARGLSVRSVLGVPRFRVTPKDVVAVAVIDARSLGVRGSWGIRVLPDRVTIVMRSTSGIQVTRRGGRMFYITVDDAATGAALLKALVSQQGDHVAP